MANPLALVLVFYASCEWDDCRKPFGGQGLRPAAVNVCQTDGPPAAVHGLANPARCAALPAAEAEAALERVARDPDAARLAEATREVPAVQLPARLLSEGPCFEPRRAEAGGRTPDYCAASCLAPPGGRVEPGTFWLLSAPAGAFKRP